MTIQQTLSKFALDALPYLMTLSLAGLGWLTFHAKAWLSAHTKNALVTGAMDRLDNAVTKGVQAVEQTTVTALKTAAGSNSLTVADAIIAKNAAVAQVKQNLGGDKGVTKALDIIGIQDVQAYLAGLVEAKVQELKTASMTIQDVAVPLAPVVPVAPR